MSSIYKSKYILMEPGPVDHSVLSLQDKHRSSDIWEGEDNGRLRCRQHLKGKCDFRVSEQVVDFIRPTQFYGIHRLGYIAIDADLITALVERWRQETHSFHFTFGEVSVGLQDVNVLLGLRVCGNPVTGHANHNWSKLVLDYLGLAPTANDIKGSRLKLTWLVENFQDLPNDPTEQDIARYIRAYLLYLIGSVILVDKSGSAVQLVYLPLLIDLSTVDSYSWGSASLACLYRNLCKASMKGVSEIAGPLILLQMWSWERILIGGPTILKSREEEVEGLEYPFGSQMEIGFDPLGCKWSRVVREYKDHKFSYVVLRGLFDRMTEAQFVWQPYTFDVLHYLPWVCQEDPEEWLVVAPMICFDVVEWHLPYRWVRQFGWHQIIPQPCNTDLELHGTDKRSKEKNYEALFAPQIAQWGSRKENVVQRGRDYVGFMQYEDPYMVWFRQHTRRIISPLSINLGESYTEVHDYRPSQADVEVMAHGHSFIYNQVCEATREMPDDLPMSHVQLLERIRSMSLQSLQSGHYGHLIPTNQEENPSPAPRYNFRHLSSSQTLTPIQEGDTPSSSSSRPNSKRGRRGRNLIYFKSLLNGTISILCNMTLEFVYDN